MRYGYNGPMATLASENDLSQNLWHWFKGSWADRLLLLVSLIGIAVSWQWIHTVVSSGPPMVMIYHDDQLLARYPIPENGEPIHFHAAGSLGDSEILINAEGARFLSSPCNSNYCVAHGARKEHGDIIACVPNRILIAIEGSEENSLDAIVE
jgi:hypothetical protein